MSHNDDPFQEEGVRKPEKEEALPESSDADSFSNEDDEDVIDLIDLSEESEDEEVLELTQTVDDMTVPAADDVLELTDETDISTDADEEIIELSSVAPTGSDLDEEDDTVMASDLDEDVIDLDNETVMTSDLDDDIIDLSDRETVVSRPDEADATAAQPTAATESSEDKEIMELIDDIQSSLDQAEKFGDEDAGEETTEAEAVEAAAIADEAGGTEEPGTDDDFEKPVILGDEETIEEDESSYDDDDFVDNLGLDLTSEFSKELFEGGSKSSGISMELLEGAMERVLNKMLVDENSLLVRTIAKAVNKKIE